jgi:hypothetical protein
MARREARWAIRRKTLSMKTFPLVACLAAAALACGANACSSSSSNALGGDDGGTTPATEAGADASGDATASPEAGADAGLPDSSTSSDSGAAAETSTDDSGMANGDSGAGSDTGGPQDSGAAPDCGSTPTLHLDPGGTIFCGYGADGGKVDCLTGTECCLGGDLGGGTFAPEQCGARGATCHNGGEPDAGGSLAIPIACMQIADCTANGVASAAACCLQGATSPLAVCTYPKAEYGTAVVCETGNTSPGTCAAGELQICSSQSDCPSGTTCTAGKWKLFQVGFCL